ncbi:hypothetical protein COLO4_36353 [Corchorus olitorius]|uniref:Uncharacterized protein n=1 Tax=Corchorus olitorius TaxID=93759 RepID=A0A1R3G9J2_9ROSI|nr:hypothetical protein COLO4_36353 [Corchorus olitorius]
MEKMKDVEKGSTSEEFDAFTGILTGYKARPIEKADSLVMERIFEEESIVASPKVRRLSRDSTSQAQEVYVIVITITHSRDSYAFLSNLRDPNSSFPSEPYRNPNEFSFSFLLSLSSSSYSIFFYRSLF